MFSMLFRNKLSALLFVLLTAAGAASLVGSEDEAGLIDLATSQVEGQLAGFDDRAARLSNPEAPPPPAFEPEAMPFEQSPEVDNIPPPTQFVPDEELIDETEGHSGQPVENFNPENLENNDAILIQR